LARKAFFCWGYLLDACFRTEGQTLMGFFLSLLGQNKLPLMATGRKGLLPTVKIAWTPCKALQVSGGAERG